MQLFPTAPISHLVKHYLFVESAAGSLNKFRLFTDGYCGIVFSLADRLISNVGENYTVDYLPQSFVYGQISEYKNIFCHGKTSLFIAVFHPDGLTALLGIPAYELVDQIIDINLLLGAKGNELTERLLEAKSSISRVQILEKVLLQMMQVGKHDVQPIIHGSLLNIIQNHGLVSIKDLVQQTGYSAKTLDRKFLAVVGISPKRFSSIIKLNLYLKGLRDRHHCKLSDLAYETGYYDYPHVYKDFKRITGVTPNQYKGNFNPLALNLLEFSQP